MTTWNGKLTFGMINFDVAMERTVKDQSIAFKQFDKESKSAIKRIAVRESDGKQVTNDEIIKGLVCDGGETVIFTSEEVSSLKGSLDHAIEVLDVVPWHQVPTWTITNKYYLLPRGSGKNVFPAYRLFVESCIANGASAIVKFVLRTKQYTGVVYVDGPEGKEYLMLGMLPYVDEVVDINERLAEYWNGIAGLEFDPKMKAMADELIHTMMVDKFDHAKYEDEFKAKLVEQAKAKRNLKGKKKLDNVISISSARKKAPTKKVEAG